VAAESAAGVVAGAMFTCDEEHFVGVNLATACAVCVERTRQSCEWRGQQKSLFCTKMGCNDFVTIRIYPHGLFQNGSTSIGGIPLGTIGGQQQLRGSADKSKP